MSIADKALPKAESITPVFSLTVLVTGKADGRSKARAANLPLKEVEAASVREALSRLVEEAKSFIGEHVDSGIPWIDPPSPANDSESSFLVPLHL